VFRQGFLSISVLLSLISIAVSAQSLAAKSLHCDAVRYSFERSKNRDKSCYLQGKINKSKNIENRSIKRFDQKKSHKSTQIGWVNWRSQTLRLELKSAPFSNARVIANLYPGTTLKIHRKLAIPTDHQHQWYEVETRNRQGFVVANAVALLNTERVSGGTISEVALQSNPTEAAPLVGFCHPLRGAGIITQGPHGSYSHLGRMEHAFDLSVDIGTPVYAMRSGKVLKIEDRFPDTGGGEENFQKFNYVLIEHTKEYRSAYLHLEQGFQARTGIKLGDRVQAGQLISYSGNSGWSTGPHLHIEIHHAAAKGRFGQTAPFQIDRICGSEVIALAQVEGRLSNC